MKILFLLISLLGIGSAFAQAPATTPMIAGCPNPLPSSGDWPTTSCKYVFYPLTDTTHAIASRSKSTPIYQHTFGSYLPTDLIVACPKGAIVLGLSCTDSTGKDASVVVAKSAIPSLTIIPINPTGPDYSTIISYLIEQSYDAGATWDTISTTITYPAQPLAHCFRITPHRKDGDGPAMVSCPLPKTP
jgi:hypothetical protein